MKVVIEFDKEESESIQKLFSDQLNRLIDLLMDTDSADFELVAKIPKNNEELKGISLYDWYKGRMGLSSRTIFAIERAKIYPHKLFEMPGQELKNNIRNFGDVSLSEVYKGFEKLGLHKE